MAVDISCFTRCLVRLSVCWQRACGRNFREAPGMRQWTLNQCEKVNVNALINYVCSPVNRNCWKIHWKVWLFTSPFSVSAAIHHPSFSFDWFTASWCLSRCNFSRYWLPSFEKWKLLCFLNETLLSFRLVNIEHQASKISMGNGTFQFNRTTTIETTILLTEAL